MKKYTVLLVLMSGMLNSMPVTAGRHNVTLGYTGAQVADFNNLRGVHLKYRYEWYSPLSIIASASYLKSTNFNEHSSLNLSYARETRIREYSLLAGPAWRFNEFFSIYGQAGATFNKTNINRRNEFIAPLSRGVDYMFHETSRSTVPMISLGTQINPLSPIVLDLSYDLARPKISGETKTFSSVNLGAGVAF